MKKILGYSVILTLLAVTMLAVEGCGSLQQPVKVFAGPVELEWLTGDWVGEYSSRTTGRTGTILFVLTAGKDTAYGSVVMVVPQLDFPNAPVDYNQVPSVRWRSVQSLGISFVAVDNDFVRGSLDPSIDPICHCTITTTFEGLLEEGHHCRYLHIDGWATAHSRHRCLESGAEAQQAEELRSHPSGRFLTKGG